MASFPCLPVLARQACAWRLHLMFPARICCFFILSPITNLSLNVLCTKHEDWCHTKTRLLDQKWINGKVYWDRLEERRKLHKAKLWFSLSCHKYVHNYNTRHKNDFELPKHKTECLKRYFIYSGTKLWNSLSDDVELSLKFICTYVC